MLVFSILPKKKKKKHFCPRRLGQKSTFSSSFFWGELKILKFPFKINWPLVGFFLLLFHLKFFVSLTKNCQKHFRVMGCYYIESGLTLFQLGCVTWCYGDKSYSCLVGIGLRQICLFFYEFLVFHKIFSNLPIYKCNEEKV